MSKAVLPARARVRRRGSGGSRSPASCRRSTSSVRSSIARVPSVPSVAIRPPRRHGDRVGRDVAAGEAPVTASCTRSSGRVGRRTDATVRGRRSSPRSRSSSSQNGPWRPIDHPAVQVGVGPVADRPVEVRARAAAAVRSRRPARRRRPGSGRRAAPARAGRRPRASVRPATTPDGSPSRRARGPRAARPSAPRDVDVDRPDRRPRLEVGLRAAVGGERDRPAVGMPRDVRDAPVAARDLARPAPASIDDEQVRPAVAVALLVPAPVGAGDPAGDGGLVRGPTSRAATIGGSGPTMNRGGSTSAVKARRRPSGDQAISPTAPCRPDLRGSRVARALGGRGS